MSTGSSPRCSLASWLVERLRQRAARHQRILARDMTPESAGANNRHDSNTPSTRLAAMAIHSRARQGAAGGRAAARGELQHLAAIRGRCRGAARDGREPLGKRLVEHFRERAGHSARAARDAARRGAPARDPLDGRGDFGAQLRVQLAIRVGHQGFIVVIHGEFPRLPSAAASAVRPRARRLVSVPIGISSTSAASL